MKKQLLLMSSAALLMLSACNSTEEKPVEEVKTETKQTEKKETVEKKEEKEKTEAKKNDESKVEKKEKEKPVEKEKPKTLEESALEIFGDDVIVTNTRGEYEIEFTLSSVMKKSILETQVADMLVYLNKNTPDDLTDIFFTSNATFDDGSDGMVFNAMYSRDTIENLSDDVLEVQNNLETLSEYYYMHDAL